MKERKEKTRRGGELRKTSGEERGDDARERVEKRMERQVAAVAVLCVEEPKLPFLFFFSSPLSRPLSPFTFFSPTHLGTLLPRCSSCTVVGVG